MSCARSVRLLSSGCPRLEPDDHRPTADSRTTPHAEHDIGARDLELATEIPCSSVLAIGPFAPRFEAGVAALA